MIFNGKDKDHVQIFHQVIWENSDMPHKNKVEKWILGGAVSPSPPPPPPPSEVPGPFAILPY